MNPKLINFFFIIVIIFTSCRREKIYTEGSLEFSSDSLFFDTIFAKISTITLQLKVYNTSENSLKIKSISLGKGDLSPFKINIDGKSTSSESNYILRGNDSMYIFAKAFITPQQNLLLETDELIFQTDNSIQKVKLIAWAKDVNILNGLTIHSDTTLSNNKAFLLKKDFIVNENATLNLSPGTELYFQRNTSLIINGGINAQGTKDSMIIIKSSRIEDDYYNIPSQWNGLQINNNKTNILNNVHISQAIQALRLGDVLLQNSGPNVSISNCIFSFSSYAAIEAYNAKINASNLIVYNSYLSNYGVIIKGGGTYSFKHATIYCDQPHSVPLISFSNEGYSGKHNALDLIIANSVIYGPERTEYEVGSLNLGSPSTYKIINSAIKTIENTSDTSIYKEIVKIESALIFSNPSKFKFEPDSLSKLVDNGDITIATSIPYDFNNNNRLNDGFPDIGAIERNP